jgi:molydopterin dinucleotide binding protein
VMRNRLDALLDRGEGEVFNAETGQTTSLAQIAWPRKLEKILSAGGCWTGGMAVGKTPPNLPPSLRDTQSAERLKIVAEGRLFDSASESAERRGAYPLVVMPTGSSMAVCGGAVPPVVTKLYRESNLMTGLGIARLNPLTAKELGWKAGQRTRLETAYGGVLVALKLDEAVMPGVVVTTSGPDPECLGDPAEKNRSNIHEICGAMASPVWRLERAALREV